MFHPTERTTVFSDSDLFHALTEKLKKEGSPKDAWNKFFDNAPMVERHHLDAMNEIFPLQQCPWEGLTWVTMFQYADDEIMEWLLDKIQSTPLSLQYEHPIYAMLWNCASPEFDLLYGDVAKSLYDLYKTLPSAPDMVKREFYSVHFTPTTQFFSKTFLSLIKEHPENLASQLNWKEIGKAIPTSKLPGRGWSDTLLLLQLNNILKSGIPFDVEEWSESFPPQTREKINVRHVQKVLRNSLPDAPALSPLKARQSKRL